ncbi:hypothetical protein EPA93_19300 [Ktedonosporobacter rubrisoli]|uniref:Uncharacterized protein n=1 Tax=Ktedonosporobacter rubrisoli TaxID=2509675 RepID=A0A4P6JRS6_KTERU|nr:hypothetical protein [Ktedonosporobacter rubrisoli]QBD78023.1 hypothetical protein EPA93_19300 [Ktedonosporobacter rubrisoli]
MLFWLLHQRVTDLQLRTVSIFVGRVVLASIIMGLGLLLTRAVLDFVFGLVPALDTTHVPALGPIGTAAAVIKLAIELLVGVFIYIRGSRVLGIEELGPVKRVLDRFKLSWI